MTPTILHIPRNKSNFHPFERGEAAAGYALIGGVLVILLIIGVMGIASWLTDSLTDARNAEAAQTRAQADLVYQQGQAQALIIDAKAQARAIVREAQAQAQALIIAAQGQSRLDSAQATSVTTSAMLPIFGLIAFGIVATVAIVFMNRSPASAPPPRIVERQVVVMPILPRPGQSRQEIYRALEDISRISRQLSDGGHNETL